MNEPEEWRPVVGWEGLYEVSSLGRVRSVDRVVVREYADGRSMPTNYSGRLLKAAVDPVGFELIALYRQGAGFSVRVHELVCAAFNGARPGRAEVVHIDGDRGNNAARNVEWREPDVGYDDPAEDWRAVEGWPGFEVSSLGRVRAVERRIMTATPNGGITSKRLKARLLKPHVRVDGYLEVAPRASGRQKTVLVHQLVCRAFHGPRPDRHDVAHNNGCRSDNRAANLRWATRLENCDDSLRHGTRPLGVQKPNHKLTEDQVRIIWAARAKGGADELAHRFGVSSRTVEAIWQRRSWKHITEGLP